MKTNSSTLYTGGVLARLELAKATLYPPRPAEGFLAGEQGDPAGSLAPVLHGVVIAESGVHYTYTRGDGGGLAETVEIGDHAEFEKGVMAWAASQIAPGTLDDDDFAAMQAITDREDAERVAKKAAEFRTVKVDTSPAPGLAAFIDKKAAEDAPKAKPRGGPARKVDYDVARRLRREGGTPTQIAALYGVHVKTMQEILKGIAVDRRHTTGIKYNKCEALRQVQEGCDVRDVARHFGVPVNTLRGTIKRVLGEAA